MSRRTRQKSIYDRIVVGSSPPPTGADPTSRCSQLPFLLYGSLSRAFSRLLCTFCHRKLCRRAASGDTSSVCPCQDA